ncbi:MAG: helix-turn-helix domain-containing protein [Ruminococcus sp.]|uniref:helix-turn-helix domain-containing protein n=1 Tax=Ruminococcus sp. TaxID=41978 RepID=UPI0025E66590|nr:helix-turn-helix domain-containing protein [Ruminococcus sp.]MCR4795680.1 helix-turn-helix domain-containing protein [Ruminococcus sp.]
MNTTEKKAIVDNILELLIQLTEDGDTSAPQAAKAPSVDKVEMLTIKESAALISGLSEHTVRQLVKQGKVKSVRTGEGRNGKILVNKADLIAYFDGKGV